MSNVVISKQEPVFELVKSMSKAEKRNFKLYATRLSGNQEAKFVALFDSMDGLEEYDEAKILQRCPVKKEQLPNMKAHLYKQILVSIRLLDVQHNFVMQLREQIDFAEILYDRGLYRQSTKILDRIKEQAAAAEQYTMMIDLLALQKKIEQVNLSRNITTQSELSTKQVSSLCTQLLIRTDLFNISMQLYGLYLKLGYARTQKDIDLIVQVFEPQLSKYSANELSFVERFHFYQAQVWYNYIQHNILVCYKYALRWVALFDANPQMKELMYDDYLRGYSRLLEGLFLLQDYKRFVTALETFEKESESLKRINENAQMLSLQIFYTHQINRHFYEGTFSEGFALVPKIEKHIKEHGNHLSIHLRMVLYYKIACLYFGDGDYAQCMKYLARVISTRDPQIRRDLQCYSRILNLICSYELGMDHNIEYQVRSVYVFLVKMNDMQQVQQEMMAFLKKLNYMYERSLKDELRILYEKIKPYENHPYERRTFYYLDILSWLESKIENISVAEVIRRRFLKENGGK